MNNIKEIVNVIKKKKLIRRILILVLALTISALVYNLIERPAQIVTGGSTGVSILFEGLFNIDSTTTIWIVSIATLILSFLFLGWEKASSAMISSFLFPFLVNVTSVFTELITINMSDMILISIFMGVLSGITSGLIYKSGFSSGGISTFSHILYKYKKISITSSNTLINGILVVSGGFTFGWNKVMYAIIILYISRIVADKVLLGTSSNKNVFIITDKYNEMREYILKELDSGLTEFDVKGGLSFNKKKTIMTAVSNSDYFKLKSGAKAIDSNVFLIVTDSYQVSGGR